MHTIDQLWGRKLPPFKPSCHYYKELDWLVYLSCDCSYVVRPSDDPRLEYLTHGGEIIGMRIHQFGMLSKESRDEILDAILETADVDLDDFRGIEDIWIKNANEQNEELSESEEEFLRELRKRGAT